MAFPIRSYARALYEASQGKSQAEVGELVERTLQIMAEKSVLGKTDVLLAEIEKLDDAASGVVRARITSAHKLDDETMELLEKKLKTRSHGKEIVWEKEIDKALLGGAVIRYGDKVLDLSLANRVGQLAEEIRN